MANAKIEGTSSIEVVLIPNTFLDIETGPEEFHKHYQNLALIRKKQEQHLEEINTQLCDYCLIPYSDFEQYITLLDLSKKQKFRWFNNNNEDIMPECVHNTDVEFDLRYLRKDTIKLEPYSHTCIDLKVVLKISATTMVQLASRNSLVKKRVSIRKEIIDARYVGNIIAML
ncbi:hypothetical protein G9A89_020625 [Geosiphon pyriformis]|nr:hypothetical protein G9A89_020625 [Geosiphon pyriformis]